ncbi:MAG: thioesterase [Betaproteobacteria bacterium]|nr:thioesterase [Betaproteobacteria bacterium]
MSTAFEIVDSHHHLMELGKSSYAWLRPGAMHRYGKVDPISRDYLPRDYRADTSLYRIVADVHVEGHRDHHHDPIDETRWLAELHRETGIPTVCIGSASLEADNVAEVLAGHAAYAFARGIRSSPEAQALLGPNATSRSVSMDDRNWRDGFAMLEKHGFVCDLLGLYPRMEKVVRLARDFPRTTIILNHMAYPPADLNAEGMAAWRKSMELVAPCGNVFMKVSGMCLGGPPWRAENHLQPIRDVLAILGPARCMFGSNFPVDRLAGSFATIVKGMRAAVSHLSEAEQRGFFRDNAARVYGIALAA